MKNIRINSNEVKFGDIFIAISCRSLKRNVEEAIEKGAGIIFVEESNRGVFNNSEILKNLIFVNDIRLLASRLAKFSYEAQPDNCVCITGTNGKSSIAYFVNQIWNLNNFRSANLGTLGLFIGNEQAKCCGFDIPNLTTPGPFDLHRILNYLYEKGIDNFVFEASSHAIGQKRLYSVDLKAAAFSNFASDHLDYHKTKEQYFNAKLKLFSEVLDKDKAAIIPGDLELIYGSVKQVHKNIITFGYSAQNDIRAENIREHENKMIFDCSVFEKTFKDVTLNLFGSFQISNILCAIGLALATGLDAQKIIDVLPNIKPLNGRMEYITSFNGGHIYVDYAHTSEGFKNALECFKKVCKGKLICVFGCGGDRDQSKRSEIGAFAQSLSDVVIVTDDNPRSEDPAAIRAQIIGSCSKAIEIGDRKEAIKYGIDILNKDDFLVIIGKGHESNQIYKDKIIEHNDKNEILKLLGIS